MSGHSKWANIKNRKGAQDKKRSEAFTKMAKDIMRAVRFAGGNTNPESNNGLRVAIEKARAVNMPKENIDRLLSRFEERKANLTSMVLEGYGPFGVPIVIEVETDNKNRSLSEIKLILKTNEGSMGDEGSVMYQFDRVAEVVFEEEISEEAMLELIDSGAIDFKANLAWVNPDRLNDFKGKALELGLKVNSYETILKPKMPMELNSEQAEKIATLIDSLEENEDVVSVFAGAIYE